MAKSFKALSGARTVVYMDGRRMSWVTRLKVNFSARAVVTASVSFLEPEQRNGSTLPRLISLPNGRKKVFTHTMKAWVEGFENLPDGRTAVHLRAAKLKGYTAQDERYLMDLIQRCSCPAPAEAS